MDAIDNSGTPGQEDLEIFRRVMKVMNILQNKALNNSGDHPVPPSGAASSLHESVSDRNPIDDRMEDEDGSSDSGDEILSDNDDIEQGEEMDEIDDENDDDDDDDDDIIWETDDGSALEDEVVMTRSVSEDQDGEQDEDEGDEDDFIGESEFEEEEDNSDTDEIVSYEKELSQPESQPVPPPTTPTTLENSTASQPLASGTTSQYPLTVPAVSPTAFVPNILPVLRTSISTSKGTDADSTKADNDGGGHYCWKHGCNGRKFATRSNLRRHQQEKSRARPSCQCPHCGAVFSRTTARNTHVARGSCNRIRRYSNGRVRPHERVQDDHS